MHAGEGFDLHGDAVIRAILPLLDGQGALEEVPAFLGVAEVCMRTRQIDERDGQLAVIRAILPLLDGQGALEEVSAFLGVAEVCMRTRQIAERAGEGLCFFWRRR